MRTDGDLTRGNSVSCHFDAGNPDAVLHKESGARKNPPGIGAARSSNAIGFGFILVLSCASSRLREQRQQHATSRRE